MKKFNTNIFFLLLHVQDPCERSYDHARVEPSNNKFTHLFTIIQKPPIERENINQLFLHAKILEVDLSQSRKKSQKKYGFNICWQNDEHSQLMFKSLIADECEHLPTE